jgi:long-chain acyl-CoA synthetase
VPINWHNAPPEVGHVLRDCGANVLVADPELLETAQSHIPLHIQCLASDSRWDAWRDSHAPATTPPAGDVSSMIYTSGTTGHPKGVRRPAPTPEETALISSIRRRLYGFQPDMRALVSAPLYHSAPNVFALTVLLWGGSIVLHDRFDARATLAAIERERVTHLFAVPTMFVRLLALPEDVRKAHDLSSLRCVIHAGAACPTHIKAGMIDWWGPVLQEYYGSTEMGAIAFCTSEDWLARPGTVGKQVDPYHITIHAEDGSILPAGVQGEIWVEVPGVPDFTYHGDPAKRAAMQRGDAIASGDIGYFDEDGYLFICGRKTDMIISGGVNIYPAEIEAALMTHADILDCAVFGMPNAEFGEEVVAAVQRAPGATIDVKGVRDHLRGRIAGYKIPRKISFHETLPRQESGKMFKRHLQTEQDTAKLVVSS